MGSAATELYVVNSATQITALTPAHAAGAVSVQVTTPTARGPTATYTYVTPSAYTRYDQANANIVEDRHLERLLEHRRLPRRTYGRSSTAGATATIYFTGTRIDWIGMKGVTPGIVDVYLDDVKKATLDLYASSAKYQVTLWTSDTLTNGTHHMDLVRNSTSLSTEFLVLDAVDIYGGNIIPAP